MTDDPIDRLDAGFEHRLPVDAAAREAARLRAFDAFDEAAGLATAARQPDVIELRAADRPGPSASRRYLLAVAAAVAVVVGVGTTALNTTDKRVGTTDTPDSTTSTTSTTAPAPPTWAEWRTLNPPGEAAACMSRLIGNEIVVRGVEPVTPIAGVDELENLWLASQLRPAEALAQLHLDSVDTSPVAAAFRAWDQALVAPDRNDLDLDALRDAYLDARADDIARRADPESCPLDGPERLDAELGSLRSIEALRCLHGEIADIGLNLLAESERLGDATVEAASIGLVGYGADAPGLSAVLAAIQATRDLAGTAEATDALADARAELITAGLTIDTCTPTEDT